MISDADIDRIEHVLREMADMEGRLSAKIDGQSKRLDALERDRSELRSLLTGTVQGTLAEMDRRLWSVAQQSAQAALAGASRDIEHEREIGVTKVTLAKQAGAGVLGGGTVVAVVEFFRDVVLPLFKAKH